MNSVFLHNSLASVRRKSTHTFIVYRWVRQACFVHKCGMGYSATPPNSRRVDLQASANRWLIVAHTD